MSQATQKAKDTFEFYKSLTLKPDLEFAKEVTNALEKYKVVTVKNIPEHLTEEELTEIYTEISDVIGEIIPLDEDEEGNKTGKRWIDIKFVPEKRTASYRFSDKRQPLHTDGAYESNPPDIAFFYCTDDPDIGGATTFIDSKDLLHLLETYEPELLEKLENTSVQFEKGEDGKTMKIISYDDNGPLLNWNYFRVSDKNDKEVLDMCEQFHQFLEIKVVDSGILFPVYLKEGEAVFFNDFRVLHGRNSFFGSRHLHKGGIKL